MLRKFIRSLGRFPKLKQRLKRAYQYVTYWLFRNQYKEYAISELKRYQDGQNETFFGYYDKSPINNNGEYLLFHSTSYDTKKLPSETGSINVVLYDVINDKIKAKHKTSTWNWQQGARLQWLTNDLYVFNDFDEDSQKYISKVYSITKNSLIKAFNDPIQDAFETNYILSLNYRRLHTLCPDYGYRRLPKMDNDELNHLDQDGISFIDYDTGKTEKIILLNDLFNFHRKEEFKESKHYVNHIMISPSGEKFIFLHRYLYKNIRYDRLILSDLKGNMKLISDNHMVSHVAWYGDNKVFGYMNGKDGKPGYHIIDLIDSSMIKVLENLSKLGDGHPTINQDQFVTDTYPNKLQEQILLYGDLNKGNFKKIASLKNSLKFHGESRCDLHPRYSSTGNSVFFDTVHFGKRELCELDLNDLINE